MTSSHNSYYPSGILCLLFLSFLLLNLGEASSACEGEPLPTHLNNYPHPSSLHISSNFIINDTHHIIPFTISQSPTLFRAAVNPGQVITSISLEKDTGETLLTSHDALGKELEQNGDYRLVFHISPENGDSEDTSCPPVVPFEMALAPKADVQDWFENFVHCPSGELLPQVEIQTDEKGAFHYDSRLDTSGIDPWEYNVKSRIDSDPNAKRKVKEFPFVLGDETAGTDLYRFRAELGTDFLTGGTLWLSLRPSGYTDENCNNLPDDCPGGHQQYSNTHVLTTLLGPGNYTLTLMEDTGTKFTDLRAGGSHGNNPECTPFYLAINVTAHKEPEDFFTCPYQRLPSDLTKPGFLVNRVYLHYHERVYMDASSNQYDIPFELHATSIVRLHSDEVGVDVDLKIKNSTGVVTATYRLAGVEEGLLAQLPPGSYNISVQYYSISGLSDYCHGFTLEIGILPTFSILPLSECDNEQLPHLEDMQEKLDVQESYNLEEGVYTHLIQNYKTSELIFSHNFTVASSTHLIIHLGMNFILGDLSLELHTNDSSRIIRATRVRNHLHFDLVLQPQVLYELKLLTGIVQAEVPDVDYLPSCIKYSLAIKMAPNQEEHTHCSAYKMLPKSFDVPGFLSTTNRLHFQDRLLFPEATGSSTVVTSTFFTAFKQSFFRVFLEPSNIDIDLYLYANNSVNPIAKSEQGVIAEKLTALLEPNLRYELMLAFDYSLSPAPCDTYSLEVALSPMDSEPSKTTCQTEKLPPTSLITDSLSVMENSTFNQDVFFFTQSSAPFSMDLPFTTDVPLYFRAVAYYEFLWSDIVLSLRDEFNSTVIAGNNLYDKNEIPVFLLSPGSYWLSIFEPAAQTKSELQRCVGFTFEFGFKEDQGDAVEYTGCDDGFLPTTLDSVAGISALSDNGLHWERDVLINLNPAVGVRADITYFTVPDPALFHAFVPNVEEVDVDIILSDSTGYVLKRSAGIEEETISYTFSQDAVGKKYALETRYYARMGSPLPDRSSCQTFPLEMSLIPTRKLNDVSDCANFDGETVLPTSIKFNEQVSGTYKKNVAAQGEFHHSISFTVIERATIDVSLYHQFPTAGLSFSIVGNETLDDGSQVPVTHVAQEGMDHSYLTYYSINPGTYNLQIFSLFPEADSAFCYWFTLSYFINTKSPDDCVTYPFPPTIWGERNAERFGGPQEADGSVRISGTEFDMPNVRESIYLTFRIVEPSWFRIWAKGPEGADLDFYLYDDVNKTSNPIMTSRGVSNTESKIVSLMPQEGLYLLRLYVFSAGNDDPKCDTFEFELAIETNTTAFDHMLCPNPMPNPERPPGELVLPYGSSKELFGNYVFSKSYIDTHLRSRRYAEYDIVLQPQSNYSFLAFLGYDFLTTDFKLELYLDSRLQKTSISGAPVASDESVNFLSVLSAIVEGGKSYVLRIVETVDNYDSLGFSYCHPFQFTFFGLADGNNEPVVRGVEPAEATDLDANRPLRVQILFSATVQSEVDMQFITDNHIIYLQDQKTSVQVYPYSAIWENAEVRQTLTVTFPSSHLNYGVTYELHIDAAQIQTSSGENFKAYETAHTYAMLSCDCSGHGTCVYSNITGQGHCECHFPYAGSDCSSCEPGYHPMGTECKENTVCGNNTCNGHGECDDSRGYPVCRCDIGYSSSSEGFCTECQAGYSGYPDCEPQKDKAGASCDSTLLPNTFDSIRYLQFHQAFHIQGNSFYIDQKHRTHDIDFQIEQKSYFRIYIEPHVVDIDIYLYKLEDSKKHVIDRGVSFNQEESIFATLETGNYSIRFQYYAWSGREKLSDCETFNMELAIHPTTSLEPEVNSINAVCRTGASKLPMTDKWSTDQDPFVIPETPLSYAKDDVYTFRFDEEYDEVTLLEFEVQNFKDVARIDIQLSYRFLVGDLALELQELNTSKSLAIGNNHYNVHTLREFLPPGFYSLVLYHPERTNATGAKCATFQFSLNTYYTFEEEDVYNCASYLPLDLNDPGWMNTAGTLHVLDDFLVSNSHDTATFTVDEESFFRISAYAESGVLTLLFDESHLSHVIPADDRGVTDFFMVLQPGNYSFTFYHAVPEEISCPTIHLEVAVSPTSLPTHHTCPSSETDNLPTVDVTSVPYSFPYPGRVYRTFSHTSPITSYDIQISEPVTIESTLISHFLKSNLHLTLYSANDTLLASSTSAYNAHKMRDVLEAGSYTLKIEGDGSGRDVVQSLPPCSEFNFDLSLTPLGEDGDTDVCTDTDTIPSSLNSIRYIGWDYSTTIHSPNWRIPKFDQLDSTYPISLELKETSIIRAYVQEHDIDIDIKLREGNGTTGAILAQGKSLFSEESFVYRAAPGIYTIHLYFWNWNHSPLDCESFNMEIEIRSFDGEERFIPPICPEKAPESFPVLPKRPSLPYSYDSRVGANKDSLYYQQAVNVAVSHSYDFYFNTETNFHAECGYDFLTGDLVMKLTHIQSTRVYWGMNGLSLNVLNEKFLPRGHYTLEIHEAAESDSDIMGCSPFTFSLNIEEAKDEEQSILYPPLPPSLDVVPYLYHSDLLHLEGKFLLFTSPSISRSLSFTLAKESILRITIDEDVTITQPSKREAQVADARGGLILLLPQGSHNLDIKMNRAWKDGESYVESTVEIAVEPMDELHNDLAHFPSSCTTSVIPDITPNSGSSYQYNSGSDLTLASSDLQTDSPFRSLRFTTTEKREIYARLGYHYLLTSLYMKLWDTKNVASPLLLSSGRRAWNGYELSYEIPEGSYQLDLWSEDWSRDVNYCHNHTFLVLLQNQITSDCTMHDTLPSDLNSQESQPYGGPIGEGGYIHFLGTNFLAPSEEQDLTMALKLTRNSIVSIFSATHVYRDMDYSVKHHVTTDNTDIQPTVDTASRRQHLAVYNITGVDSKGTDFDLIFHYPHSYYKCPYFTLDMVVSPVDKVISDLTCPDFSIPPLFPTQEINYAGEVWHEEISSSHFTQDFMTQHGAGSEDGFDYPIHFSVDAPTDLSVQFGFNPLFNAFSLKLEKKEGENFRKKATGTWSEVSQEEKKFTLLQEMDAVVLSPGEYRLHLQEESGIFKRDDFCYPFSWSIQLVPSLDSPYVQLVDPPGGQDLSPDHNLYVQITLSASPYNSSHLPITRDDLSEDYMLKQAFYLRDSKGHRIDPTALGAMFYPNPDDYTLWQFTFAASNFQKNDNYTLHIGPRTLFDAQGNEIKMYNTHIYSMVDVSCVHGSYDTHSATCICDDGYSGDRCELCAAGYEMYEKQCVPSGQCDESKRVCGCMKNLPGCAPAGICIPQTSGNPVCKCHTGYSGPHCECPHNCGPNGECNPDKKICDCDAGWTGPSCNTPAAPTAPTNSPPPGSIAPTTPSICPNNCNDHGKCNETTAICVCDDGWDGEDCSTKIDIVPSPGAKKPSWLLHSPLALAAIIGLVMLVIAIIVIVVVWRKRRKTGGRKYAVLDEDDSDDEDDTQFAL